MEATTSKRHRPYPAYKDSGVERLGEIPVHWSAPRMWRISTAASGGTPSKAESDYWGGGIPWVSPKDMKRRIIDSSKDTITEQAVADGAVKMCPPPVVLIVVRGMILAHTFPVAVTTVPVTINQDMKALRFHGHVGPGFAAWSLEGVGAGILGAVVEEAAHGTRAIRMNQWRLVAMAIPPGPEQRSIVDFLDRETARIDELVAKKGRLIELLQEKRTALITHAVTKGLDTDVPMKDSGVEWIGEVPAHWEPSRLKHVVTKIGSGKTPRGGGETYVRDGVMLLRSQNIQFAGLRLDNVAFIDKETDSGMAGSRVLEGDVLLNITGASLGRCCVARLGGSAANVNQHVCVIRPRSGETDPHFLGACIASRSGQSQVFMSENGVSRDAVNFAQVGQLVVAGPPAHEQQAIAEFLAAETARIDALNAKVQQAIRLLKEYRAALISAAVTGKIDVRDEVA